MLYNHKWSITPSLDGFIAWLREQDPNETYDYWSCAKCACDQYADSIRSYGWVSSWYDRELVQNLNMISRGPTCESKDWTFGAALARALAYRASL